MREIAKHVARSVVCVSFFLLYKLVCSTKRLNWSRRWSGSRLGLVEYTTVQETVDARPGFSSGERPFGGTYILSLAERRHKLGKRFFQRIIKNKSNVLFYLLPAKRAVQLTTRLRCARQYPTIYALTNRYKNSFILFGLKSLIHFQWCDFVYFVYAWFSCMFV